MAHKAVRMEAAAFADRFFPVPSDATRPEWASDIFNKLAPGGDMKEIDIVEEFMKVVNTKKLAPGLKMAASTDRPDMEELDEFRQKVDAAFFKMATVPSDGRPHWVDQLVSVEFKRHETNMDPFDDRYERAVDADAVERKKVRGQIITYAEQIFRLQHRTALYMLLVIGRNFRFVRWDRSGAIVTRAVDYVAQPDVLCDFLWRLGKQSDEQLGVDPSATRLCPGDEDYKLMDECAAEVATDLATDERIVPAEDLRADPPVFKYVRLSFRQSMQANWPRYRLEVPHGEQTRSFLVGKPMFHARGMAGRGTRGYVALDVETKRFVWLKDAWRVHYELVDQEGTVLSQLNQKEVRFVPTLVCHGDIRKQTTVTPKIWDEQNPPKPAEHPSESSLPSSKPLLPSSSRKLPVPSSSKRPSLSSSTRKSSLSSSSRNPSLLSFKKPCLSSSATLAEPPASSTSRKRSRCEMESDATPGDREDCPLRRHVHYRIVVEEVAMPLSEIQCGRQLVQVVFDCLLAHWDATEKAQLLHRDVSGGNVLILPSLVHDSATNQTTLQWRGMLADWEMSKPLHDKEELRRPRQPPRTGTWQFLSVGMLGHKPRAPGIPDELESLLYVILYYAVRYLSSNCEDAAAFLETFFDAHTVDNGVSTCGQAKLMAMEIRGYIEVGKRVRLKFNSPLDTVFAELLPCFKAHYKVQNYRDEQSDSTGTPRSSRCKNPSLPPSPPSPSPGPKHASTVPKEVFQVKAFKQKRRTHQDENTPTPDEEHDALLLADHGWMGSVLADALTSTEWRADKVGDRVPLEYKPQYDVAGPDGPAESTLKRRRTATQSMPNFRSCHSSFSTPVFHSAFEE